MRARAKKEGGGEKDNDINELNNCYHYSLGSSFPYYIAMHVRTHVHEQHCSLQSSYSICVVRARARSIFINHAILHAEAPIDTRITWRRCHFSCMWAEKFMRACLHSCVARAHVCMLFSGAPILRQIHSAPRISHIYGCLLLLQVRRQVRVRRARAAVAASRRMSGHQEVPGGSLRVQEDLDPAVAEEKPVQ